MVLLVRLDLLVELGFLVKLGFKENGVNLVYLDPKEKMENGVSLVMFQQ